MSSHMKAARKVDRQTGRWWWGGQADRSTTLGQPIKKAMHRVMTLGTRPGTVTCPKAILPD